MIYNSIYMTFNKISDHLGCFTVGIAGAGGLGSNCAVALARSGVGKLIIADFDIVDISNLNRQYFFSDQVGMFKVDALKHNINRIDKSIGVTVYNIKLSPPFIKEIFNAHWQDIHINIRYRYPVFVQVGYH